MACQAARHARPADMLCHTASSHHSLYSAMYNGQHIHYEHSWCTRRDRQSSRTQTQGYQPSLQAWTALLFCCGLLGAECGAQRARKLRQDLRRRYRLAALILLNNLRLFVDHLRQLRLRELFRQARRHDLLLQLAGHPAAAHASQERALKAPAGISKAPRTSSPCHSAMFPAAHAPQQRCHNTPGNIAQTFHAGTSQTPIPTAGRLTV